MGRTKIKGLNKDIIIADILAVKDITQKIPSNKDYQKLGKFDMRAIKYHFGSWATIIMTLFGIDRKQKNIQKHERPCQNCKAPTKNPQFCSRSCSTSYNNKKESGRKLGRRKHKHYFCRCGQERKRSNILCPTCYQQKTSLIKTIYGTYIETTKATKKDVLTKDTQKYKRIRYLAQQIGAKMGILTACKICGYSNHVECCHIRPIQEFPDDTLISTINHPKNLIGLCPNHHWELDNKLLALPQQCTIEDSNLCEPA